MLTHLTYISDFQSFPTRFREPQSRILQFLKDVHTQSSQLKCDLEPVENIFERYGIHDNLISSRGFECEDLYLLPDNRILYQLRKSAPTGAPIENRMQYFAKRCEEVFNSLYPPDCVAPKHLVHVTCTGYLSPSAPQLLASQREWSTEVTHAYHMGCYAALPSTRLAIGQMSRLDSVDIVHTEMCSLHMNPSLHSPEQAIVQSLFADGHIRYRVTSRRDSPCFQILSIREKIIPDSRDCMSWVPASDGMLITLSRDVPRKIEESVRSFTLELIRETDLPLETALQESVFAIHPGGPRILDSVARALELRADQYESSRKIFFENGNMSSATLPHIWHDILQSDIKPGTRIISLAFGPGLTVFGSVFEYQA